MRKQWLVLGLTAVLTMLMIAGIILFSRMQPSPEKVSSQAAVSKPSLIGLWVVPQSQVRDAQALAEQADAHAAAEEKTEFIVYGEPDPFYFDGETVTMHLLTKKAWMWRSKDDYYRLKTKWDGDDLLWLPPFGQWEILSRFRDGCFQVDDGEMVWRFERVPENKAPEALLPLVMLREKHDYDITPRGYRSPGRVKNPD